MYPLGDVLLSRDPSVQVPSALEGLTVVFGMGTRGTLPPSPNVYSGSASPNAVIILHESKLVHLQFSFDHLKTRYETKFALIRIRSITRWYRGPRKVFGVASKLRFTFGVIWISPRPISIGQLHAFALPPPTLYLVVFKGSY